MSFLRKRELTTYTINSMIVNRSLVLYISLTALFGILLGTGCSDRPTQEKNASQKRPTHTFFQLLDSSQTGVNFVNAVTDGNEFNVLTYRNFYNGGGVAIGDINNDNLPDLYFTSNLATNKLYLNKGNFTFEEITQQAGVGGTKAWSTGVAMADVNGDGWMDIYVSNSGDIDGDSKENELFINQGDLTFKEEAAAYGLNNQGYSTQACFFDYDRDGDLDCYLLNNSFKDPGRIELFRSMRDKPDELGGDKLYRNDGNTFTDVTIQAGIYTSAIGFGLGASIGDLNRDGWPDLYVSNDFWERDYLYLNNGDGTFSEELNDRINFCSISSMGGDIADLNNDGYPEIISTDMLAADNYRLKAMSAFDPYHLENTKYRANYHYQIGQNCLHLNDGTANFHEIGMLSGIAATDWSWGALVFDFENDGKKDVFISNGIQRDLMYMDFRDFLASNDLYRKIEQQEVADFSPLVSQMPANPLKNFAFQQTSKLRFTNKAEQLGFSQPSFSNGAAYGDLDNDGDWDLVVNNVNMPAFVYQNQAEQLGNHYLKLTFEGPAQNPLGIGVHVEIETNAGIQSWEHYTTRSFESSVEPALIFGLGKQESIQRLTITWPDQKVQVLTDVPVDQTLTLRYTEAQTNTPPPPDAPTAIMHNVSASTFSGSTRHRENTYNDFDHEILLPKMLSTETPRLLTADVNGDGKEDVMVLGASGDEDKLFLQTPSGTFQRKGGAAFRSAKDFESTCGAFFDADQDGDPDLMLGAGGNEYQRGNQYFILRYYENDGRGNFRVDNRNIPQVLGNFSCLEAADVNGDGREEIFLGGRCVPGNYGLPARSFLLTQDQGKWVDMTPEALAGVGLVTDAIWSDIDADEDPDLIVVGEWMAVQIFRNEQGLLLPDPPLAQSKGWWTRIEAADIDQDGDPDFVLGNWGLNSKLSATPGRPLTMYVNDFDRNEKSEFIINWYAPLDSRPYPFATKMDLTHQLPGLRKQILKYEDYSQQTYESLFPTEVRQTSIPYEANHLNSSILWNENGQFVLESLPIEAQVAPAYGIAVEDWNQDGHMDIWLGGNFYALKPQVGRHDASRGVYLSGTGNRSFRYLTPTASGIFVKGEVRDAKVITTDAGKVLLISRNDEEMLAFTSEKFLP